MKYIASLLAVTVALSFAHPLAYAEKEEYEVEVSNPTAVEIVEADETEEEAEEVHRKAEQAITISKQQLPLKSSRLGDEYQGYKLSIFKLLVSLSLIYTVSNTMYPDKGEVRCSSHRRATSPLV